MARKNIFLCSLVGGLVLAVAPAPAQNAREGDPAPLDPAACDRLDPALSAILDRPGAGVLVALGASARRSLRCRVPQTACQRIAEGLAELLGKGAPEHQVLSVLGLHDGLNCPGTPLVHLIEQSAAPRSAALPPPSARSR